MFRSMSVVVGVLLLAVGSTSVATGQPPDGMVLIPGGEFEMGNHFPGYPPREYPVHAVYVDSFYIDIYEVTNQQYADALNWAYGQGLIDNPADHGGVVQDSTTGTEYCDTAASSSESRITWDSETFGVTPERENHPMFRVS